MIDEARKGNYGSSHKQNRNGTHFARRSLCCRIGILRANVDLEGSKNRRYMAFHSYESLWDVIVAFSRWDI